MSDFKFSCPQCGQHLSGDSEWGGRQIQCPGCQATINVPRSASASPPLPPVIASVPRGSAPSTSPRIRGAGPWLWIGLGAGALVLLALVAVIAALVLPALSKAKARARAVQKQQERAQRAQADDMRAAETAVTTELASVIIADAPASGTLRGQPFRVEAAELNDVNLLLKQGTDFFPDASLRLFLFQKSGEALDGRTITVGPKEHRGIRPHIHVSRKDSERGVPRTEIVSSGYTLRLEFGERQDGKLPGRIYLELGERHATKVTGTFEAKISK